MGKAAICLLLIAAVHAQITIKEFEDKFPDVFPWLDETAKEAVVEQAADQEMEDPSIPIIHNLWKNPCTPDSCQNGGECISKPRYPPGKFRCRCKFGFVGRRCEIAPPARPAFSRARCDSKPINVTAMTGSPKGYIRGSDFWKCKKACNDRPQCKFFTCEIRENPCGYCTLYPSCDKTKEHGDYTTFSKAGTAHLDTTGRPWGPTTHRPTARPTYRPTTRPRSTFVPISTFAPTTSAPRRPTTAPLQCYEGTKGKYIKSPCEGSCGAVKARIMGYVSTYMTCIPEHRVSKLCGKTVMGSKICCCYKKDLCNKDFASTCGLRPTTNPSTPSPWQSSIQHMMREINGRLRGISYLIMRNNKNVQRPGYVWGDEQQE